MVNAQPERGARRDIPAMEPMPPPALKVARRPTVAPGTSKQVYGRRGDRGGDLRSGVLLGRRGRVPEVPGVIDAYARHFMDQLSMVAMQGLCSFLCATSTNWLFQSL